MHYSISNELGTSRTDEIVEYLTKPRLWVPEADYPDFSVWVERVHGQLKSEDKRAIVAMERGSIVGAIVYQKHKTLADTLELKNISVRPDASGRYLASFLLRNAEIEGARDFNVSKATCDAKVSNVGIRMFLLRHRYVVQGEADLYRLGAGGDLVFGKPISSFPRNMGRF
jgi:ribosomal protein S18 acetylase RimI-like enzyme